MGSFFAYSLQSAICLAVFYLFFKVLLSRDTFHRFNRMALLGVMILSLIIPFVTMALTSGQISDKDFAITSVISGEEIAPGEGSEYKDAGIGPKNIYLSRLLLLYFSGCAICFIYTIISTIRIMRIIHKGKRVNTDNRVTIIITSENENNSPFSWMNYIVLSQTDYDEAGKTIIAHEKAHISLHHAYDLIIAQICIITQWFNPAIWLFYQELQYIHEYEADEKVLRQGIDARQYQLLIIKKAVGARLYSMANSFSHSNLKKRITMMLQKKSNSWARLKYTYVLPLAVTTVAAFANPEISQQFEEISSAKISHFALNTSTNEVKNLPEADISEVQPSSESSETVEVAKKEIDSPAMQPNEEKMEFAEVFEKNAYIQAIQQDIPQKKNQDSVYSTAEEKPQFPGGEAALWKWIHDNLDYPEEASKDSIHGTVLCAFIVEKDGSVSNVVITRSAHPYLDKEAARVLKKLPKFMPGKYKGEVVRIRYNVPVRFVMKEPTEQKDM